MSARSSCDSSEQPEDGDLGLGDGCQPGSLPPFELFRWPRSSSSRPSTQLDTASCQDSHRTDTFKRPASRLAKLTSKLGGFYSKSKLVSEADDSEPDQAELDSGVVLGTSLRQQTLVFRRQLRNIQRRRNVHLQQLENRGDCAGFTLFSPNSPKPSASCVDVNGIRSHRLTPLKFTVLYDLRTVYSL